MPSNPSLSPKKWVELQPSTSEAAAGVIFKVKHREVPAAIVIRRLAQRLDKDFDIKNLPRTIVEALRQNINGFKLINSKLTKIGRYQAAQVQYQYPKRGETYTDLMLVVPMQWQTFYITLGAKKSDSKTVQKDFPKISLGFLNDAFSQ